ncbi:MAG: DUF1801 domain-containing protein [Pseudomonadota bacterium]
MAVSRKTTKRKAAAKKTAAKKKTAKKTVKKTTDAVTVPNKASVAAFIDAVEDPQRKKDAKTLLAMMKKVTGEKPVMWGPSIIGFGKYHYKYESGREGDMLLVGFSPRKANSVLYVLGSLEDDEPLLAKLGKYKRGRACLYVNKLDDVDAGVLEKLVAKSYKNTAVKWGAKIK